jgi:hypothetical protein
MANYEDATPTVLRVKGTEVFVPVTHVNEAEAWKGVAKDLSPSITLEEAREIYNAGSSVNGADLLNEYRYQKLGGAISVLVDETEVIIPAEGWEK